MKKALIVLGILIVAGLAFVWVSQEDEFSNNMMSQLLESAKITQKSVTENTNVILRKINNVDTPKLTAEPLTFVLDSSQIPELGLDQPEINIEELEQDIHNLVNIERKNQNLKSLSWDSNLHVVARSHSNDMAQKNYFAHVNLEGKTPSDRADSFQFNCQKIVGNLIYSGIAENIFQNNLYNKVWTVNGIPTKYEWNSQQEIAESTIQGWMDSPGHRKNILGETFDREAIGIIVSNNSKVFITQNLC